MGATRQRVAYRLLTDQLGSVRLVVRVSDGTVVQHVDYDPWGVPTVVTGDWTVQSFGFAGGVYDSETELVRFGARDYDARVGRWTAKDPVRFAGDGANLYVYVAGMPTHFVDPTGWIGMHFGISGGFGSSLISLLGMVFTGAPPPAGVFKSGGVYFDWEPGTGFSGGFYETSGISYGLEQYAGVGLERGGFIDGSRFPGGSHSVGGGASKKLLRGSGYVNDNGITLSVGPGVGAQVGTKPSAAA